MKRKRLEAGYEKQTDAARAIGVSQDLISRLESRFSPNVRVGEFGRVIEAYGIVPNDAFAVLGMYTSLEPNEETKEYMRREIIPLLSMLNMGQLGWVRRMIQAIEPKLED